MASVAHPSQSDIGDISEFVTSTKVTITDVVLAILVLIAAWIIARLARRGVRSVLGRVNGISEDLRQLTARITFYFVLLIGIGVAMTFVGAEIQPILTAGILIGVIAVLALRGVAENFAAGIILQTRRPIQLGDDIDVLEHSGIVREINSRSVILEAWDRRQIHIPNTRSSTTHSSTTPSTTRGARRSRSAWRQRAVRRSRRRGGRDGRRRPGSVADRPPEVVFRSVDPGRVVIVVRFAHGPAGAVMVTSDVVRAIAVAERSRAGTSP